MKELSKTQMEALLALPVGEEVHVATSEYSIDPIPGTGWNPVARASHQCLKGLVAKGYIKAEFFWRGAAVTRLR